MIKCGPYRMIFKHVRLDKIESLDIMDKMVDDAIALGQLQFFSNRANGELEAITKATIQKQLTDGDLTAWATIGVGYSFCQCGDQFSKKKGRRQAGVRAILDLDTRFSTTSAMAIISKTLLCGRCGDVTKELIRSQLK